MKSLPIINARHTAAIIFNPVHDFADEDGLYAEGHGKEDTLPVRNVMEEIRMMAKYYHDAMLEDVILCISRFEEEQFGKDGPLSLLCTSIEGRASVIPHDHFSSIIEKTDDSLFSATVKEINNIILTKKTLILAGVTTIASIARTIEDMTIRNLDIDICVPEDAIASRVSQRKEELSLLQKWMSDAYPRIHVLPTWKVAFVNDKIGGKRPLPELRIPDHMSQFILDVE